MRPLIVVVAILLAGAPAGAAPRTLLLLASTTSDLDRDALADAIRLQILDLGVAVEVIPERDPARPVPERLHEAVGAMDDAGAEMALFYDRAPGDPEAVLYAAHRDGGEEAIVAVIRLPGEPGPSLYRSFALRVRDLVADLTVIEVEAVAPRWAIGAGWAVDWLPRLDPILHGPAAGVLHIRDRLELQSKAALLLPRSEAVATGTATLAVLDLALGARLATRGRLVLGGGVVGGAKLLVASGELPDGRTGDVVRALPVLGAETFARVPAFLGIELELALAAQALLVRERMTLAGTPVFDTGPLAIGATLRALK